VDVIIVNSSDDTPVPSDPITSSPEHTVRDKANERLLALDNQELESLSVDEIRQTLHELHVHQIELEMQNEELRLAQVQLETARARYSDLYDLAPAGYCTLGENGLILEANLTAATLLGLTRGALVRMSIHQLILNEDQDIFYLHRKQLIETGIPQAFDLRMVKMDKTVFWARLHATASHDSTGNSVFLVMMSDITERKHAEEMLLKQTAELRVSNTKVKDEKRLLAAVMDALPTGVAITDSMGGTLESNIAYKRIWGGDLLPETRSVEDYVAYKAWWDDSGKPVAPEEWASAIAVQNGEVTVGQVIRIERFDGSESFVINSAAPIYDTEGSIVGSAVAIQDITELKRVERALMESEMDFARAQEVGSIGSWRINVRQSSLTWSDETYRIFAVPPGTPLSYEFFLSCVHPDDRANVDAHWLAALGGAPYDFEHRIVAGDQLKWVREKAFLEFGKDGMLIGGFGITQDITDLKQAEEQLQALNEDLERKVEQRTRELQETQSQFLHAEKFAAIGKLSASIAHEFNNPLQGIMTILKGLKKRAILQDKDRELVHVAIDESERMKNLIRSLQDFNRPSSGKKVLMDVRKSLDSLLLLCKSDFKSKRISLEVNYAERLPQILAVPDQIKQVFLNLLTNAADACTQSGGVITISTRQEGEKIAVAIRDTGIGIRPEQMDLLFQPFYTTKPEIKGTGLGLPVCHGIVQSHKGKICVESEPGKGATFTVLLPTIGSEDFPGTGNGSVHFGKSPTQR